ncbi:MAG: ImmA/IrrE family metallo-endopeptidase [Bacteroidales bacterium]
MSDKSDIARSVISPPGDTIKETLEYTGMNQAELAERMGRPKEKINDIIHGREPITTKTAFQLERVLGIPASFWINRENSYRKELYELQQEEEFEKKSKWLSLFPVREMKKLGWLPDTKEKHKLVDSLLKFFGIASPAEWEKIYIDNRVSVAFRTSLAFTSSPQAVSVWLRKGELQANEVHLQDYNKKGFKSALTQIKELAYLMPDDFSVRLQSICAKNGVAVVFTPQLPKAPISGATRWYHGKPLIQLSGRYKTNDHFWFTFFHEAAHILYHGKKEIFLESQDDTNPDPKKEEEADRFAANFLLSENEFKQITEQSELSENTIIEFAHKFRTPAGVIVGRLQRQGYIQYSQWNNLRQKIELFQK